MPQQLRVLIAFVEDLGSLPSTYMVAQNCPEDPMPFSKLHGLLYAYNVLTYTQTYTYKINK